MSFDGFWGFVLLLAVAYFGGGWLAGWWGKLDKSHPRNSMTLNVALGLLVIVAIVRIFV